MTGDGAHGMAGVDPLTPDEMVGVYHELLTFTAELLAVAESRRALLSATASAEVASDIALIASQMPTYLRCLNEWTAKQLSWNRPADRRPLTQ